MYTCIGLFTCILLFGSCVLKRVSKNKDLTFNATHNLKLDVYAPRKIKTPKPVLVFIHGGNWNTGHKSTYAFFGKGMARKGVVTVIIDYRLSPLTTYAGMATDGAKAVQWVKQHISAYGGDSSNVYISGHSAGGHLAALLSTDDSFLEKLNIKNAFKGSILIDPFGLDMYTYFKISQSPKDSIYYPTFTKDPAVWKKGSPIDHLHKGMPEFLVFLGGNTYPAITYGTNEFVQAMQPFQPGLKSIIVKHKRHVPMIAQFYNPHVKAYRQILDFMKVDQ